MIFLACLLFYLIGAVGTVLLLKYTNLSSTIYYHDFETLMFILGWPITFIVLGCIELKDVFENWSLELERWTKDKPESNKPT